MGTILESHGTPSRLDKTIQSRNIIYWLHSVFFFIRDMSHIVVHALVSEGAEHRHHSFIVPRYHDPQLQVAGNY